MIVDQNAIIRYLSPSLERVLGYKPQDLIGLNTNDFIHPEDLASALEEFSRLLKKPGGPLSSEFRFKHRRGSWRVLEVRTTNLLNNPSVLGIVVNMRDITKRRRAQHELLQSEGHLRSLMESASNFVVYRLARDKGNPSGFRVVFASPSISEIIAVPNPTKYETWFENNHPDDLNRFVEASQRASKTLNFDVSMRIYHPKKEEWRWIQAIATGVPDRDGGTYYANGIIIDITERKKAEEELEIKTKNLEEVNTALKVLLKRREDDKSELEQKVMANVNELVAPYLGKIKKGVNDEKTRAYLSILESSLNTITSPFARKMSSKYLNLTSAEIEVANFVRHGKSTKEIAEFLNLSGKTIETHRMNIRKKLGITNKKANLRTYLQSIH